MGLGLGLSLGIGVAGGGVTPVPMTITGLVGWWRADQLVTLSGGNLSAWNDSSGSGDSNKNFAPTGTGYAFNATDAAYNNQATFTSTAAKGATTGTWASSLTAPYTIFIVGNDDNSGVQEIFYNGLDAAHNAQLQSYFGTGYYMGSSTGNIGPVAHTAGTPQINIGVYAGASSKMYLNSNTPTTGSFTADVLTGLRLGFDGATLGLIGKIAEVGVYSKALSSGEVSTLNAYLSARYSITVV